LYIRGGIDKLKHLNVLKMNQFCLNCEDAFSSPLLEERNKRLGRNFLFTVLGFAALCIVSYLVNA